MDRLTIERRRWNMSRIRAGNTRPEMTLRRYLHKLGFRYRIGYPTFGKPDIVFPKNELQSLYMDVSGINMDVKILLFPKLIRVSGSKNLIKISIEITRWLQSLKKIIGL